MIIGHESMEPGWDGELTTPGSAVKLTLHRATGPRWGGLTFDKILANPYRKANGWGLRAQRFID